MTSTDSRDVFSISGQRVMLTGAAGGIGRATARLFAEAGARLAVSDVDGEGLAALVTELRAAGADVWPDRIDLADPDAISAGVASATERLGGLDVLINNGAVRAIGAAIEVEPDGWDRVLDINLRGVFLAARAAARVMAEQGSGRIINLASQLGLVAAPGRVAYVTSKGAVIQLTRALALEWVESGILVNAVAPGPIDTPLLASLDRWPEERERLRANVPMGRFGRPEEIAAVIMFLASPAASFITGHTLVADGGYTIH